MASRQLRLGQQTTTVHTHGERPKGDIQYSLFLSSVGTNINKNKPDPPLFTLRPFSMCIYIQYINTLCPKLVLLIVAVAASLINSYTYYTVIMVCSSLSWLKKYKYSIINLDVNRSRSQARVCPSCPWLERYK